MAAKKELQMAPAEPPPSVAEARVELLRGLRLFRAFEAADKALAVLESAEQLTRERDAQAEAAKGRRDQEEAALEDVKRKRNRASRDMEREAAEHAAKLKEASDKAAEEAAQAQAQARAELASINAEVSAARAAMLAAVDQTNAAKAELRDLEERIARARNKVRELLGG